MSMSLRAACLAAASAWSAGAQEIAEQDFLGAFAAQHATRLTLQEGLARAEAARRRAGTLPNPRVDFWQERPDDNPRVSNFTLAWTPPFDGRYALSRKAAEAGVSAAKERLATDEARLRAELRRLFADWSLATEREAVARQQYERVRTLSAREQERAHAGETSGLSARRFALAESDARAAAGQAEAERIRAEAAARAWRPDLGPDVKPANVELPAIPADLGTAEPPQLRALQLEAEQAALQQRLSGRYWGFPELQVGWQRQAHGALVNAGPILAASWSVPLLDRNQAARVESARLKEIAQARLSLATTRTRAEIQSRRAAYAALVSAVRDTERSSADALRVVEASQAAFQAGESSVTDLLEALRSASEARARAQELRARALETHRELEAALGRPFTR